MPRYPAAKILRRGRIQYLVTTGEGVGQEWRFAVELCRNRKGCSWKYFLISNGIPWECHGYTDRENYAKSRKRIANLPTFAQSVTFPQRGPDSVFPQWKRCLCLRNRNFFSKIWFFVLSLFLSGVAIRGFFFLKNKRRLAHASVASAREPFFCSWNFIVGSP